jgi:hypothetical protein
MYYSTYNLKFTRSHSTQIADETRRRRFHRRIATYLGVDPGSLQRINLKYTSLRLVDGASHLAVFCKSLRHIQQNEFPFDQRFLSEAKKLDLQRALCKFQERAITIMETTNSGEYFRSQKPGK